MSFGCAKTITFAAIVLLYGSIDHGTASADDIEEAPNSTAARTVERTILPKDIWAFDMPGTRELDIRRREGEYVAAEGPLVWKILSSDFLANVRFEGQQRQGFAVQGEGMEALEEVGRIVLMDEEPDEEFSAEEPLTIVFFTSSLGAGLEFECVEIRESSIDIRYHFVPRLERDSSLHVALIPLGRLAPGPWTVAVTQGEVRRTPAFKSTDLTQEQAKWQKTVCLPFDFLVSRDATVD